MVEDNREEGKKLLSPHWLLAGLAISIAIAELLVMVILHAASPEEDGSRLKEAFVDAALLTVFLSPLLYMFVYRPFRQYMEDHIRMTEEISKSEDQLNRILDTSLEGFWMVDDEGKIQRVNRTICKILGRRQSDLLDSSIYDFVDDDGKDVFKEQLKMRKEGVSSSYEVELKRNDGEMAACLVSATPIYKDGAFNGSFAMVTDISRLKRNSEELRAAKERSEEATLLKDKFVSLVSHDLKGPLTNILGTLRFLLTDNQVELSQDHERLMGNAIRSGETMVGLIEELLSISRFRTGQIRVAKRFVDMEQVVRSHMEDLSFLASEKGVRFVNKVEPDSRLYADPTLYGQVVQNLITNGIKFSRHGGEITFYQPDGEPSSLAVSDSGVGMPQEKLSEIFKYEIKTSTYGTGGEKGTGLGLPFCNEIVSAMGGRLEIRSIEGEGTTAFIHMEARQPKVGVVVGDKFRRKLFLKMMLPLDVEMYPASRGEELLRLMDAGLRPDLIIAEAEIGGGKGVGGLELLRQVRSRTCDSCLDTQDCDNCGKLVPFVMISNFNSDWERAEAMQLRPTDFLAEPFIPEDILPRLRKVVG